jgi:hypothetical protein
VDGRIIQYGKKCGSAGMIFQNSKSNLGKFISIAAGNYHSIVLTDMGMVSYLKQAI